MTILAREPYNVVLGTKCTILKSSLPLLLQKEKEMEARSGSFGRPKKTPS